METRFSDELDSGNIHEFNFITYGCCKSCHKTFVCLFCSKKRFDEHQAEDWWTKNKDRLLKWYSPNSSSNPTASESPITPPPPPEPVPQSDPSVPEKINEEEPDSEV